MISERVIIAGGLVLLTLGLVSNTGQALIVGAYNMVANLIKKFEGFSNVPYIDAAGKWTIGYGHLIKPGESFSSITEDEAINLLNSDMTVAKNAVDMYVTVPINDNQKSALISFTYNVGSGAFGTSMLLAKLNSGDYSGAANEFDRWVYAGGRKLSDLVNRRYEEKMLFLS